MKSTAAEATNRHQGQMPEHAQRVPCVPAFAAKAGRSLEERTREFNEKYKDWIAEQNEHFDKHGLWNEEFRRW